tara:strand:- start:4021 stop:4968 length:948 start_codon:yes stop_codon:yes gene_type:complete
MAVATGDNITAAEFNSLQSRVSNIMGTGSGDSGYGQTLTSAQVAVTDIVQATDMINLKTDIDKANNHQSGSDSSLDAIATGKIIGADATGDDTATLTSTDGGFNDYETAVALIETNKLLLDSGNSSVEAAESSSRTTAWNGTITHDFDVTFADENQRRFFFNAGGEIRFSASRTGGSTYSKNTDWTNMLSNMGTIKFGRTDTTCTGTGTTTTIGNSDLTATYQTIFTKVGSGNYAENEYEIQARFSTVDSQDKVLQFTVRFEDNDAGDQQAGSKPGPAEDEDVTGTITSTIQQLRATGSNVEVTTPSYNNTSELA